MAVFTALINSSILLVSLSLNTVLPISGPKVCRNTVMRAGVIGTSVEVDCESVWDSMSCEAGFEDAIDI